jgi:hypothetical protein
MTNTQNVLEVSDLRVYFYTEEGVFRADILLPHDQPRPANRYRRSNRSAAHVHSLGTLQEFQNQQSIEIETRNWSEIWN